MPESRPLPVLGRRAHELRVRDRATSVTWRIVYRLDEDAIVVVHWWAKKTETTARREIATCQRRLRAYDGR